MTLVSIGDLASGFASRLQLSRTRDDITRLSTEVSTGRTATIVRDAGGDMSRVSALERSMDIVSRYRVANSEAAFFLTSAQSALENAQGAVGTARSDLLLAGTSQDLLTLSTLGRTAEQSLEQVISSLNTQVAGASVFSGVSTGTAPLRDSETLMALLSAEVSTATTIDELRAGISGWFDDPAGFDAVFYQGASDGGIVLSVAEGRQLDFGARADDQAIKDTIEALATAALVADEATPGSTGEKAQVLASLGAEMTRHEEGIIELRGGIGVLQQRTELAAVDLAASQNAFEMALADAYGVDPYEAATRLDASIQQLETLYAITARLSELSLTRYLR